MNSLQSQSTTERFKDFDKHAEMYCRNLEIFKSVPLEYQLIAIDCVTLIFKEIQKFDMSWSYENDRSFAHGKLREANEILLYSKAFLESIVNNTNKDKLTKEYYADTLFKNISYLIGKNLWYYPRYKNNSEDLQQALQSN